jgi:hypothetical protein
VKKLPEPEVEMDSPGGLARPAPERGEAEREENDHPEDPAVGRWFWIQYKDEEEPWLGCVTRLGSNYAKLEYPSEYSRSDRIHFDNFHKMAKREFNAEAVIADRVEKNRRQVGLLMGKVQDITNRLALNAAPGLTDGGETKALARISGDQRPISEYKEALILAKETTLPELFKQIEKENKEMGIWMSASLIPLRATIGELRPLVQAIEGRIFNVELYAGLTEEVEKIQDGAPAAATEKLRIFQGRLYMDEECLVDYQHGGMEFKDMPAFDAWLLKPDNLNRILPFPRCIAAFKVRRDDKNREFTSISKWIRFVLSGAGESDKLTYLYIRNGEQVFRLGTAITFEEKLFPDLDEAKLRGVLYAEGKPSYDRELITEGEYLGRIAEEKKERAEYEAYKKAEKAAKKKGLERGDEGYPAYVSEPWERTKDKFKKYDRDNIYYDDITAFLKSQMDKHNRLVLVLQGLLDRSPVLHPHPPWQLWTPEGFAAALDLIYDQTKGLTAGEAPDFEAYRARLNESLAVGCVTIGQYGAWGRAEAEKYNNDQRRSRYSRYDDREKTFYKPYGNPGPGGLAYVHAFSKKKRTCTYSWTKRRLNRASRRYSWEKEQSERIPCTFTVDASKLLNVSAYKPGDFKQFFADPRTRADYLQWAPFLLEAEEYHAGNREVGPGEDD